MPFDSGPIPALGQYKGTMTLTMGFATAAMTPAPGLDTSLTEPIADTFSPVLSDPAPGEGGDLGAAPPVDESSGALTSAGSSAEAAFSLPGDSAGTGGSIGLSEPTEPAGSEGTLQPSTSPPPSELAAGEDVTGTLATAGGSSSVDVRGIYLIGVLAAATALAGGEAVRRLGRLT
jgi:hypothetical protein